MDCPYCGRKMEEGMLHGMPGNTVFWLPGQIEWDFLILTRKKIEKYGGIVLCEKMNAVYTGCLLPKERPASYCCKQCKTILTKF